VFPQAEALDGVLKNDDEDGQQKLATTRSNIGEALEKTEKKHEQELASMKKKHKQELEAIRNEATSSFELGEGQMVDDGSSSVLAAAMSSVQTADSDLKIKIKKAILEANAKNSAEDDGWLMTMDPPASSSASGPRSLGESVEGLPLMPGMKVSLQGGHAEDIAEVPTRQDATRWLVDTQTLSRCWMLVKA